MGGGVGIAKPRVTIISIEALITVVVRYKLTNKTTTLCTYTLTTCVTRRIINSRPIH
jgi:hypothetical protein